MWPCFQQITQSKLMLSHVSEKKGFTVDCTSSTLSHLEIPRKNILESFPVLPSAPPKHKPLKSRSYVWFPLRIVNVTYQKPSKKTVREQKIKPPKRWDFHRLNVLDPVLVLGWICCAYHQSTQYQKPCLNVERKTGSPEDGNWELPVTCMNPGKPSPAGSVQSL